MKVLMMARKTLITSPGGDTIQIFSTAKYLRLLGVQVDIKTSGENFNAKEYDLLHFFNIIRPDDILPYVNSEIPFVISTIFVDYSEYEKQSRTGLLGVITRIFSADQVEYLKAIARFFKNGDKINSKYYLRNGQRKSIRHIASKAAMLLPNSLSEYQRFVNSYKIEVPYHIVPNAIDITIFNDEVQPNNEYKNHILCVGRIEGRKNQLNLIKAIAGTKMNLTLIGKPSPNHSAYYQECLKLIAQNHNIRIIEHINHEELAAIYKAAKVHVLPSWFETTGLSSLEAAVMDCNIVVTNKGDTLEYFEDLAYYCDPENVKSIQDAIYAAYQAKVNPKLKARIERNFIWQKAAEETLAGYKILVKERLNN